MNREELKRRSLSGGFQLRFSNQKKIFKIIGLPLLVVCILYLPQTSFAQDPILSVIEVGALNYDEGQIPTPITNSITVTDADSPLLSNATIRISSNFISTEDLLQFTDDFSITGSYDPSTGTLTLTGPATIADFTSALRSITYQNSNNNNPSDLVRTISFSVNDGSSNSLTVARDIQVNRINDAPTGLPDNFVIYEDTDLDCGCILINDTDPDGDDLIALHADPPLHGTVTDLGGFYIYTPYPDFYGTDTFTYYANDGTQNSAPILVNVTVLPVNDAPIAANDAVTTNEDTPIGIPILSNDTDVDDVLNATMIVLITSPTHGTLTINASTGAVVYSPSLNYNGNDSFTYQVKDAAGALSNIATVAIVIQPVNDVPIANADFATTPEETTVSIPVLANDTDVDSSLDPTSLSVVTAPLHGQTVVQTATGMIEYKPQENFTGIDSFTYTVKDSEGATSAPISVTISVSPVNDVPVAVNDQATTNEDTPVDIDVLLNDTDVDGVLDATMIVLKTSATHGTLTINTATGAVVYSPSLNYIGNDSFTYQVRDAAGALSSIATVAIVIQPVNDVPIANADFATTPEETPVSIPVLANDTDVDSSLDPTSLFVVTAPLNGQAAVQPSTGRIVYTPQENFTGTDSFTYTVKDSEGAASAPISVTITVSPVNDVPVAVNDEASTNENTPVDIDVISNDIDVDNDVTPSAVVIATNPVHGTIVLNPVTGSVVYTPEENFIGNDSFTYTLQDPSGSMSPPATVGVHIIPTPNQAPDAVDDGPIMNTSSSPITIDVLANDQDEDGDELTLVSVTNPSIGTVKIVDGMIVYQPAGLTSGTVTFSYTIQDPSGLSDEAVVTVENSYLPLVVSEGFSPNGNHNNETWFIQGIENYPNNSVKIFDRWGFLVYQKQHYENITSPWDGRGNMAQQSGKLLDQGTYYYILDPGSEMKTMTGYVVIIR